jgi:hypothetical protein
VRSGSTWSQQAKLTAADGLSGDNFGTSVAISGATVIVGASGQASSAGGAYVFVRSGSAWSMQDELSGFVSAGAGFGFSVAIAGNVAVVGIPGEPAGANMPQGAVFVFARAGSDWFPYAPLSGWNQPSSALFGWSVAISGTTALAGTPDLQANPGAAYVFPYL